MHKMALAQSQNLNKKPSTKVDQKMVEKSKDVMKNILDRLDEEEDEGKHNLGKKENPTSIHHKNEADRLNGLNPNFLPEFSTGKKQKPKAEIYELNTDIQMDSIETKNNILAGREVKSTTPVLASVSDSGVKRNRAETGNKTSEDIFLNRTPITVSKSNTNTVYYTPNSLDSKNLNQFGRTPKTDGGIGNNGNAEYLTPIKPMGTLNNIEIQPSNELQNSNSSCISLRHNTIDKLPVQRDGSLRVYWYDAIEDNVQLKPCVIFFGKVYEPNTKTWASISVIIKNIMKTLYIFPKNSNGEDLEKVYSEFEYLRKTKFSYIKQFMCKYVKKKYCFELPIPHKEYTVLKAKYNADYGTIPANLTGETFDYIFGRNTSLLEKIILSRKLKGPSWLKIKNFEQPSSFHSTWCKYEVILNDYKQMCIDTECHNIPPPPLRIMGISTKTINTNTGAELFSISMMMKDNFLLEDNNSPDFTPFILMRKFDSGIGMKIESSQFDHLRTKYGHNNFLIVQNENAILNQFVNKIYSFDPDIIVGHNLYTGHMELICHRINKLKTPNWSKVGRFKREVLPKYLQVNNLSNVYIRTCLSGRLICDTFLSSKDILRESNYDLSHLCAKYLNKQLVEMDVNGVMQSNNIVRDIEFLLESNLMEAYYSYLLMDKYSILPLTKQLTYIAGNLWIKSLQNSRADRCEMLLLHEFHKEKYLLPDKITRGEKFDEEMKEADPVTGKRKPQYLGGLVFEPEPGLYDSIVLLLDFNSLYPSIIQEYDICFSTVIRKPTQSFNYLESKKNKAKERTNNEEADDEELEMDVITSIKKDENKNKKAILPSILENLVNNRKVVKQMMKTEKDTFRSSLLEIKQKAIKLSANSLYGYLGYKNSRFYAKSIAALVTSTGRRILKQTAELVKNKHSLHVIYGDTDSLMINTLTNDLNKALELGMQVKKSVNERYRLLEMELDGVFKTLLLLKKKKYAALKYEQPYGTQFTKEYKGLDLVRRDWCELSKQTGLHILDIILSNNNKDEIISLIFEFLRTVNQKILDPINGFPLKDYEITKQLTKNIEDYVDFKALPHVKIAKRLKDKGDTTIKVGSYIPYIICRDPDESAVSNSKSLADRSYHPKEIMDNPHLSIDYTWYKENQILSSVSRLVKHINEINMGHLAECLGIDASKFNQTIKSEPVHQVNDEITKEVKYFAKTGITVPCLKCGELKQITSTEGKSKNIMKLLQCDKVKYFSSLVWEHFSQLRSDFKQYNA